VANLEKLVNEDLDYTAKHAGSFEAAEQTKEVPLDPTALSHPTFRRKPSAYLYACQDQVSCI
jgi:hypothetical protein